MSFTISGDSATKVKVPTAITVTGDSDTIVDATQHRYRIVLRNNHYVLGSGGIFSPSYSGSNIPGWLSTAITEALSQGITNINTLTADLLNTIDLFEDGVHQSITSLMEEDLRQDGLLTSVKSSLDSNVAAILTDLSTKVTSTEAEAIATSVIGASFNGGDSASWFLQQISTYADELSTYAESISSMISTINDPDTGLPSLTVRLDNTESTMAGQFKLWDGVERPTRGMIKFIGDIQYMYLGGALGEASDGWVRTDQSVNIRLNNLNIPENLAGINSDIAALSLDIANVDGHIDAEEASRIQAILDEQTARAADLATRIAADAALDDKITAEEQARIDAANELDAAYKEYSRLVILAMADGELTPEEQLLIAEAQQAVDAAKDRFANLESAISNLNTLTAQQTLDIANMDGRITAEEASRVQDILTEQNARAVDIAERIAEEAALDGKITAEEQARIDAANMIEAAYKEYSRVVTLAIADGVLTPEEEALISESLTAVDAAKTRFLDIENSVDSLQLALGGINTDTSQNALDIANLDDAISIEEEARVNAILAEQNARAQDISDRIDVEAAMDGRITAEEAARMQLGFDLTAAYKDYTDTVRQAMVDGEITDAEEAAILEAQNRVDIAKAALQIDIDTAKGWASGGTSLITGPNGEITGWSYGDGTGVTSQFKINADIFMIADSTNTFVPFEIVTNFPDPPFMRLNARVTFADVMGTEDLIKNGDPISSLQNDADYTDDTVALSIANNIYSPNTTEINGGKIRTGSIAATKLSAAFAWIGGWLRSLNYSWNGGKPIGFGLFSEGDTDSGESYNVIGGKIYGAQVTGSNVRGSILTSAYIDHRYSMSLTDWQDVEYVDIAETYSILYSYRDNFVKSGTDYLLDEDGYCRLTGKMIVYSTPVEYTVTISGDEVSYPDAFDGIYSYDYFTEAVDNRCIRQNPYINVLREQVLLDGSGYFYIADTKLEIIVYASGNSDFKVNGTTINNSSGASDVENHIYSYHGIQVRIYLQNPYARITLLVQSSQVTGFTGQMKGLFRNLKTINNGTHRNITDTTYSTVRIPSFSLSMEAQSY